MYHPACLLMKLMSLGQKAMTQILVVREIQRRVEIVGTVGELGGFKGRSKSFHGHKPNRNF